ncbi:FAD-binding protein [Catenulispora yoronensis]
MAETRQGAAPGESSDIVTPADARYPALTEGYNHRFVGTPDEVWLVRDTAQVVAAVENAVATGRRVAVRSGGHCFEDFTTTPDIRLLIDVSGLDHVGFDAERRAFVVGAGARLEKVYRSLHAGWGVTIPGGTCFDVGVGGHFAGGGYGPLSRRDGLVVDHLEAVEVVVVDGDGRARVVVGSRDPGDPHHDLWWAHAGGGGGTFGVVTRYWLRTPGALSLDPSELLPPAPAAVRRRDVVWSWDGFSEQDFHTLLRNYFTWYEENSAPDSPSAPLWSNLIVMHRAGSVLMLTSVIPDDAPDAEKLLGAHIEAIVSNLSAAPMSDTGEVVPWMESWMPSYNWPADPAGRYKHKAAYLRRGHTDGQIATIYRYLTMPEHLNPMGCLVLTGFGGQVNAVAPDATAVAQRDAIIKASYSTGMWTEREEDEANIGWVRAFYGEVFQHSGGVPVPDGVVDGSYISYPDGDLADPEWNRSGMGWEELYFGGNYPRLQRVKQRFDPGDVFRHALSVRLPSGG